MSETAAAPGWYPDPWFPGGLRWFDGTAWTPATSGPGATSSGGYDSAKGASTAAHAGWAFLARGIAGAVQYLTLPLLFGGVWDEMRTASATSGPAWSPFELGGSFVVLQVAGLVIWAALAFVCIWSFRATTNARAVGLPTQFEPGLAVAGWIIPVANLVMPYLVVRDLFPHGDPGRRAAGWWWGSEMGGALLGMVAFGAALFGGRVPGAAVGVVAAGVLLAAGLQGRRLTRRALELHTALAQAAGLT